MSNTPPLATKAFFIGDVKIISLNEFLDFCMPVWHPPRRRFRLGHFTYQLLSGNGTDVYHLFCPSTFKAASRLEELPEANHGAQATQNDPSNSK